MERKIGKSGGVTIPSNLRRDIGIAGGEKVDLSVQDNGDILIRRIAGTCMFCGSYENVSTYKGRFICDKCRSEIGGGNNAE